MPSLGAFLELYPGHKFLEFQSHCRRNGAIHTAIQNLSFSRNRNWSVNSVLRYIRETLVQGFRIDRFCRFHPVILPFAKFIFNQFVESVQCRIDSGLRLVRNKRQILVIPFTVLRAIICIRRKQNPFLVLGAIGRIL